MNHKLVSAIKEQLKNNRYPYELTDQMDFNFILMTTEKKSLSRYAVVCAELGNPPEKDFYSAFIKNVKSALKPKWLIAEIGVCFIFCGNQSKWEPLTKTIRSDKTGTQSLIIQGIIFLDCETGALHTDGSSWGPIKFGHAEKIKEIIQSEVQKFNTSGKESARELL